MSILRTGISVKDMDLRNRIVMPPMANNLATDNGQVVHELTEHYLRRAREGVGLIVVEHAYVHQTGRVNRNQLGIHSDSLIAGLKQLASEIQQTGARAAIQLTHAGCATTSEATGSEVWGASARSHPRRETSPRALTTAEVEELVVLFGDAAERAKKAGFDSVEIHGAHGYLLNQFLSPLTNDRTDRYGGDLRGRATFPLEVIGSVRQVVGDDFPLMYRLGVDDLMPGGLTGADTAQAAKWFCEAGVDLLDISGGFGGYGIVDEEPGFFRQYGRVLKKAVPAVIMVTGGITTSALGEEILRAGDADLIGVGRALLRDESWASKALAGQI